MSDQNPPSSEPTPTPEGGSTEPVTHPTTEGGSETPHTEAAHLEAAHSETAHPETAHAETAHADETATYPAAEGHVGDEHVVHETTTDGEPVVAAPAKRRRNPVVIAVAALLVIVLIAGGAFAAVKLIGGNGAHKISTPATAGKMKRDTTKEKALAQQLDLAQAQFKSQVGDSTYVKRAVYNQADSSRGPSGGLVFFGAKLTDKQTTSQTPAQWISDKFTKQAKANGLTVVNVDAGDSDTKAACASIVTPQKVAICAWRTKDSIGELIPTVPGYDSKGLATIMRAVRADVEKSE